MDKTLLEGLSQEQKEALKNCKTMDDVLKIVDEESIELSEAQMEAVSGGCGCNNCCDH